MPKTMKIILVGIKKDKNMLVKYDSLKVADKVLAEVRRIWPSKLDGVIRCFANFREQGYVISVHSAKGGVISVLFSENRTSEHIKTYLQNEAVYDGLTDEGVKNVKLFQPKCYVEAAEYIVKVLQAGCL